MPKDLFIEIVEGSLPIRQSPSFQHYEEEEVKIKSGRQRIQFNPLTEQSIQREYKYPK